MNRVYLILAIVIALPFGCKQSETMKFEKVDVQGHRGARGLYPENTIPAFLKAIELGVTTLELDLAVTKDKELVVSHEPYMGAHICLDSMGNEFTKQEELSHNIYQMTYEEVASFDVGTKFHPHFPNQEKIKVSKPLFKDLLSAVNDYLAENNLPPVRYNIEIKSSIVSDNEFHPAPQEYSRLVYDFIVQNMDKELLNVQSFDFRVLQYFNENYPDISLAVLIESTLSIDQNLEDLGFTPQIYSSYYPLLDQEKTDYLHSKNIKVIPWTVNESEEIKKVLSWGVDGIISDYPDRVLEIISD